MEQSHAKAIVAAGIIAVMAMVAKRVYELLTVNKEYEMRKPDAD